MRRYAISTFFIAFWMACGWYLPRGTDYYLFFGIPLVIIFQLGIARRPLHQLWVRDGGGGSFRLDRTGVALAITLMLVPALNLMRNWHSVKLELIFVSALIGAIPTAFAFRRQTRDGMRQGIFFILQHAHGSPATPFYFPRTDSRCS
jgi:hypothetical protein